MPEPTPSISTNLLFLADFEPEDVTRRTSLTPTRTYRRGDPTWRCGDAQSPMRFDHDGWRYTVVDANGWSFDEHIRAVGELLDKHSSRLAEARVASGANLVIRLSGITSGSTPEIRFPPQLVSALAAAGASIEVDISHAPNDEADDSPKT